MEGKKITTEIFFLKATKLKSKFTVVRFSLNESRSTLTQEFKVNRSIAVRCIKMVFNSYVLCSLRNLKLKTDGQTI